MANSISLEGIHAGYGAVRVIENVSLNVASGETVVLLGTNGNGKSTLMKCVMGMLRPTAGSIVAEIDGVAHDLMAKTTEEIVDLGVVLVPEGRRLFPKLTVEENLRAGAYREPSAAVVAARIADIFRAHVIDTTSTSFIFEITGGSSKIDKFTDLMRPLGLVEVSRTGVLSIERGEATL